MILCPLHNLPVRHDKDCYRDYQRVLMRRHGRVSPTRYENVWPELAVKVWRKEVVGQFEFPSAKAAISSSSQT